MKLLYLFLALSLFIYAQEDNIKRELKGNSTLKEIIKSNDVEAFNEVFAQGVFYGRLDPSYTDIRFELNYLF